MAYQYIAINSTAKQSQSSSLLKKLKCGIKNLRVKSKPINVLLIGDDNNTKSFIQQLNCIRCGM